VRGGQVEKLKNIRIQVPGVRWSKETPNRKCCKKGPDRKREFKASVCVKTKKTAAQTSYVRQNPSKRLGRNDGSGPENTKKLQRKAKRR